MPCFLLRTFDGAQLQRREKNFQHGEPVLWIPGVPEYRNTFLTSRSAAR